MEVKKLKGIAGPRGPQGPLDDLYRESTNPPTKPWLTPKPCPGQIRRSLQKADD